MAPRLLLIDSAAHRGIFIGRNPYRRPTTGLEHQTRTSKPRQTTIFLPTKYCHFFSTTPRSFLLRSILSASVDTMMLEQSLPFFSISVLL